MSRVTAAIQEVRRYLNEYNVKDINKHQILYHLNNAQGDIALKEDCIEKSISVTLVSGQAEYDYLLDPVTGALSASGTDVIKRVKSVSYPDTWNTPIFPVDKEFDEMLSTYPTLSYVQYVIIRNGKIRFYGIPGDADAGAVVTLQCYLNSPSVDANDAATDPVDFETPKMFDTALHYKAASELLPIENPGRDKLLALYEKEVGEKGGVFNHKINYVRSPKPNW